MSEYTPGPWQVKLVSGFDNGQPFASVWVEAGEYHSIANLITHRGVEKNAHLIASAPEMYVALKTVLAVCEIPEVLRVLAMNALAKAEGKASGVR